MGALVTAELEQLAPGLASNVLTGDELDVASRVIAGERNREIAAALFVSEATVEARLTKVYRKLGVRSRTELARRMAESLSVARHCLRYGRAPVAPDSVGAVADRLVGRDPGARAVCGAS